MTSFSYENLCKLLKSFNLRCGLRLAIDMSGQPMAVYMKYRLQIVITMILLLLLAVFIVFSPQTFLSSRIYIAYMSTIPFTAIMAVFMTLLVICGEMDLSFPAIMALGGFTFAWGLGHTGSGIAALGLALAAGTLAGALNGIIVVYIGVPSIIATIGTQFFWRGTTALLSQGLALSLVSFRESILHSFLTGRIAGLLPVQFLWFTGLALVVWVILNLYPFGDNLRFVGDNPKAANAMGIPVAKTRMALFALMGTASAFTGVLVCSEMANWWPTQGEGYMLLVFASVFIGGTSVFGGTGTIYGTCIGAVIIGIIEAGIISAGLSGFWTRTVYGVIVVFAVSVYALIQKKKGGLARFI